MPLLDGHRQTGHSLVETFPQEQLKKYDARNNLCISSWSCDVEGHAKKCVERYCELANEATQQLYEVATPCIMHFRAPLQGRSNGICWTTNHCLLTNCSENSLYSARIGSPVIFTVCEQSCPSSHKVDQSMSTNAWRDSSRTFITRAIWDNTVTWDIPLNNADRSLQGL